jgi:hypothetical protein
MRDIKHKERLRRKTTQLGDIDGATHDKAFVSDISSGT